jgi:hypothetical protein
MTDWVVARYLGLDAEDPASQYPHRANRQPAEGQTPQAGTCPFRRRRPPTGTRTVCLNHLDYPVLWPDPKVLSLVSSFASTSHQRDAHVHLVLFPLPSTNTQLPRPLLLDRQVAGCATFLLSRRHRSITASCLSLPPPLACIRIVAIPSIAPIDENTNCILCFPPSFASS